MLSGIPVPSASSANCQRPPGFRSSPLGWEVGLEAAVGCDRIQVEDALSPVSNSFKSSFSKSDIILLLIFLLLTISSFL